MKTRQIVSENWVYAALFLIGLLLLPLSWTIPLEAAAVLCKEIGFALMVAMVLVFSVERITRRKQEQVAETLIEEIKTDVFRAIYRRHVPQSILEEVEKCLLKSDVVREDYSVDYNMDYLDAGDQFAGEYLSVSVFSKYRLKNVTDKQLKYDAKINLERPLDDDPGLLNRTKVVQFEVDGVGLGDVDLAGCSSWTDNHLAFTKEVIIPPSGSVEIVNSCSMIKRKLDVENWSSRIPSTGMTLRVNAPPGVRVMATASHSEDLKEIRVPHSRSKIWELNHGIFPFQSVIFWWKA